MSERQFSSTVRRSSPSGDLTLPTISTSQKGRYLGRVVVEAWEPDQPGSDGIAYVIHQAHPEPDFNAQHEFARDLVARLHARLQRIHRGG